MDIQQQCRKDRMKDVLLQVVFIAAVSSFLYGYFITRREYHHLATPVVINNIHASTPHNSSVRDTNVTNRRSRYDRVFLVLIDGLRYDQLNAANFPHIHRLLTAQPEYNLLLPFQADAPTTTSQRLKALGTGSLPTFIDFSENLHSSEVREDSWLGQFQLFLSNNNSTSRPIGDAVFNQNDVENSSDVAQSIGDDAKDMIVMGDDTWVKLFPHLFNKQDVFESFNTFDIDRIDDHIFTLFNTTYHSELRGEGKRDWMVWVTHFLAIDHLGHSTQNAFHPLIASHLQHYDVVLQEIIALLPKHTLFILCGDHGMTDNGQHGGSSDEELLSAVFFHSTQLPLWRSSSSSSSSSEDLTDTTNLFIHNKDMPFIMQQIDLVPTLAALFNLPMPYSSLGKLLPFLQYHPSLPSSASKEEDNHCNLSTETEESTLHAYYQNAVQIWNYFRLYFQSSFSTPWRDVYTETLPASSTPLQKNTLQTYCHHVILKTNHPLPPHTQFEQTFCEVMFIHWEYFEDVAKLPSPAQADCAALAQRRQVLIQRYHTFLSTIQDYMKSQFTQFKYGYIILGFLLMLLVWMQMLRQVWAVLRDALKKAVEVSVEMHQSTHAVVEISSCLYLMFVCVLITVVFVIVSAASNSFVVEEKTVLFVSCQAFHLGMAYLAGRQFQGETTKHCRVHIMVMLGHLVILGANRVVFGQEDIEKNLLHGILLIASVILWICNQRCIADKSGGVGLLQLCGFVALWTFYYSGSVFQLDMMQQLASSEEDFKILIVKVIWTIVLVQIGDVVIRGLCGCKTHNLKAVGMNMGTLLTAVQILLLYAGSGAHAVVIWVNVVAMILTIQQLESMQSASNQQVISLLISLYLILASRNVFYLTGHGLSFDQLQLSVGFIGMKTFQFHYAGCALALNTFGGDILLMLLLAWLPANSTMMQLALWVRMSLVMVSALVAFVLRRHLMVWAIFAPKVLFEVAMCFSFLLTEFIVLFPKLL